MQTTIPTMVNEVRVTKSDPDNGYYFSEKTAQTVDYLTKIAKLLGNDWAVTVRGLSSFELVYKGGHRSSEGITVSLHNGYFYPDYAKHADYWRFSVTGTYPTPDRYDDQMKLSGEAKANIRIDNPVRAAKDVQRRIIPEVTRLTGEARAHCARMMQQQTDYAVHLTKLGYIVGSPFTQADLKTASGRDKYTLHLTVNEDKYAARVNASRYHEHVEFIADLSPRELVEVINLIKALRAKE